MTNAKYSVGQAVHTFDRAHEPEVPFGTVGVVTHVYDVPANQDERQQYEVRTPISDGVHEGEDLVLFFYEDELELREKV